MTNPKSWLAQLNSAALTVVHQITTQQEREREAELARKNEAAGKNADADRRQ